MTSLSMKTYPALFSGIIALLFLEIRSEIINNTVTPAHSVPTPAKVTSPTSPSAAAAAAVSTSISSTHAVLPRNSTDKTRTVSEKSFAHTVNVSGTERPTTHKDAFSTATTASTHQVNMTDQTKSKEEKSTVSPKSESSSSLNSTTKAPALTSGQHPTTKSSTDASSVPARYLTTILPKTDPQTPENTTALSVASKPPALTTSFVPISHNSSSENTTPAMTITTTSTMLPDNSSKGMETTKSIQETTLSTTTIKYFQNVTKKEFNQSTIATTELPAFTPNATNGSALVDHTKTTGNTKNFSATTQPTTGTTAFSNNSTTIAEIHTTNASILVTTNATQAGLIPVNTKIVPTKTPNSTTVTEAQPCSSLGVAKQCLIIIAFLAVVATVFIISTIALCTKLSSRKYKLKRQQRGTEMTCISSLLRERSNHTPIRYTRQRSPVPNGVLVIHNYDDSDEEAGDNLTLSSFLPENDRYV